MAQLLSRPSYNLWLYRNARRPLLRRWSPRRTYTPSPQREWYGPRLEMCTPLQCTHGTVKQWQGLLPKSPPESVVASSLAAGRQLQVVDRNNDYVEVTVDIRGFNASAYKCIDIRVIIDQIQDVQYAFRDFDSARAADLKTSFRLHSLDYRAVTSSLSPLFIRLSSGSTPSTFWIVPKKGQ